MTYTLAFVLLCFFVQRMLYHQATSLKHNILLLE